MEYGYARVSAKDQNEARQIDALHAIGLPDSAIYVDKQSGKVLIGRSTKSSI